MKEDPAILLAPLAHISPFERHDTTPPFRCGSREYISKARIVLAVDEVLLCLSLAVVPNEVPLGRVIVVTCVVEPGSWIGDELLVLASPLRRIGILNDSRLEPF